MFNSKPRMYSSHPEFVIKLTWVLGRDTSSFAITSRGRRWLRKQMLKIDTFLMEGEASVKPDTDTERNRKHINISLSSINVNI